jgi:hypothetical protein
MVRALGNCLVSRWRSYFPLFPGNRSIPSFIYCLYSNDGKMLMAVEENHCVNIITIASPLLVRYIKQMNIKEFR